MVLIEVRKAGEDKVLYRAKSNRSVSQDKVAMLSWVLFVERYQLIDRSEWAQSQQPIAERYGIDLREIRLDGRSAAARELEHFTWLEAICAVKNI